MNNNIITEFKEIHQTIDTSRKLLIDCQDIYFDIEFFANISQKEYDSIIKFNPVFERINLQQWLTIVIKLNLLLNTDESYNILKSLNIFHSNHKKSSWKDLLVKKDVRDFINKFEDPSIKEIITKIKNIRHKHVAHLDKNRGTLNQHVSVPELKKIITLSTKALDYIFSRVMNMPLNFEKGLKKCNIESLIKSIDINGLSQKK